MREMKKNKSRRKAVGFESNSKFSLKRRRKKIEMIKMLLRKSRLNDAESFDPKRNHTIEIKEAGNIQPAMASARYSAEVSRFSKMVRNAMKFTTQHMAKSKTTSKINQL